MIQKRELFLGLEGTTSAPMNAVPAQPDATCPMPWAVFEATPSPYLLLASDDPDFTVVGANDAYLRATTTRREDILGRGLLRLFSDNPDDPAADGVRKL